MLLLAGLLWLPGFAIERTAFRNMQGFPFRGLTRLSLGTAFWMSAIFLLCAFQSLTLPAVGVLIAVSAAGTVFFARPRVPRSLGRWRSARVVWAAGCALPIVLALAVAAICSMDPVVEWDAGVYHLAIPKLYIAHGGFLGIPFNVYSNWPLNGEMVFTLAILLKDYVLANSVQCIFAAFCAYAIFEYVRAGRSAWCGFLAVLFMLFNHTFMWEADIAYVEIIQAFFTTAAFIFIMRAADEPDRRRVYLLLSGINCGIMSGMKATGFLGVAPMIVCYLVRLTGGNRLRRGFVDLGTCFFPPIVVLVLPWILKAAWFTGNPVYPFLYDVWGGPDWSQTCWRQFADWQSSMGMGRTILDYIRLPYRVILSAGQGYAHFDGSISAMWIALLPISIVAAFWNRTVRACLVVSGVYFVCWAGASQQVRFLLPIIPALAIGAALALGELADRLLARRLHAVGVFAAVYCVTAGILAGEVSRKFGKVMEIVGMYRAKDREAVMKSAVPGEFAFLNHELPPDAKVLFLNTNYGFYSERAYVADSFFEASQISDWLRPCSSPGEIGARLKERRITHILHSRKGWGIAYPPALWGFLEDSSMVELLGHAENGDVWLFALK
jgi:hypothetical protein